MAAGPSGVGWTMTVPVALPHGISGPQVEKETGRGVVRWGHGDRIEVRLVVQPWTWARLAARL